MISNKSAGLASSIVFIFPIVLLYIPHITGLLYILAVGAGLLILFKDYGALNLTQGEKQLFFACTLLFILACLNSDEQSVKLLSKLIYLPLTIPVYLLFRRCNIKLAYFWYGLALGSIFAGAISIVEFFTHPDNYRARSLTHPIIFGNLSLTMAILAFAGSSWFKNQTTWLVILPMISLLTGILASTLAQARNAWIAMPILILIALKYTTDRVSSRLVAVLLILLLAVAFLIPATYVKSTIDKTITNIELYLASDLDDDIRGSSLPGRFEMWQAAIEIIRSNPIVGVGWGHYKSEAQKLVEKGFRHPVVTTHESPHNQYLSVLVNGGIIALIGLLLVFVIPARLLFRQLSSATSESTHQLAVAGLLLLAAFSIFGLSESILERSRPGIFFSFYLAVIFGLIKNQQLIAKDTLSPMSQTDITENQPQSKTLVKE